MALSKRTKLLIAAAVPLLGVMLFLLRDYICLLHPELGLGQPKYYTPVATE